MSPGKDPAYAKRVLSAPSCGAAISFRRRGCVPSCRKKALAQRMGTTQSLVARWEQGKVSPRYETVVRAVRASGLDLSVGIYSYDSEADILIRDRLALGVEERGPYDGRPCQ